MLKALILFGAALGAASAVVATIALPASASTGQYPSRPASQPTGAERAALSKAYFKSRAIPLTQQAFQMQGAGAGRVALSNAYFFKTSVSSDISAAPDTSPINSSFQFCNANIACFDATLHYVNRTKFQLESTQLIDSLCDNRSVFADVYDQNGFLGEFRNSEGCHNAVNFPTETMSDSLGESFVQIKLYACSTSCSSVASSLKHSNPYF